MEEEKIKNPNAFPENCTAEGYRGNVDPGMTLRDYFAAKAMQSNMLIAAQTPEYAEIFHKLAKEKGLDSSAFIAETSYQLADAMLKERTKKQ